MIYDMIYDMICEMIYDMINDMIYDMINDMIYDMINDMINDHPAATVSDSQRPMMTLIHVQQLSNHQLCQFHLLHRGSYFLQNS